MTDIQSYIDAAEARGRGSRAELEALRSIVATAGGLLGADARAAVAADDEVQDNLEFNLHDTQADLDRTDPKTWLLAAEQHGSDEDPDYEFGDLQAFARAAWSQMGPEEVALFEASAIAGELAPAAAAPTA